MEYLFIIVPIFIGITFLFTIIMIVSPKARGKMMSRQIKAAKYMLDESEEDLRNMATKSANISKEGISITTKAIKDGFTDNGFDSTSSSNYGYYCKSCGEPIDIDSIYCKKCGKKQ